MNVFGRLLHDFGVRHLGFMQEAASQMKFSDAIRKGHYLGYPETINSYSGCAIGTAFRARTGKRLIGRERKSPSTIREEVAIAFGVPYEIVEEADHMHSYKGKSRVEVASWLESQGY